MRDANFTVASIHGVGGLGCRVPHFSAEMICGRFFFTPFLDEEFLEDRPKPNFPLKNMSISGNPEYVIGLCSKDMPQKERDAIMQQLGSQFLIASVDSGDLAASSHKTSVIFHSKKIRSLSISCLELFLESGFSMFSFCLEKWYLFC